MVGAGCAGTALGAITAWHAAGPNPHACCGQAPTGAVGVFCQHAAPMQSITEHPVAAYLDALGPAGPRSALRATFLDLAAGRDAVLPRSRAALSCA